MLAPEAAAKAVGMRQGAEQRKGAVSAMSDQSDDRRAADSADEVLKALDELESVLRENAESEGLLQDRIT